jgi:hypothetical protein
MADVILQISGTLFNVPANVKLQVLGGPLTIQIAPQNPVSLIDIWNSISDELYSLVGISLPDITSGPWAKIFQVSQGTMVMPSIFMNPSGASEKFAIYLALDLSEPIGIGGTTSFGGLTITLEPDIQIWSLYIGYTAGQGVELRAKISAPTTKSPDALTGGNGSSNLPAVSSSDTSGQKFQIVSYPFPVPAQNSVGVFQLKYLGIGQRVGPTVVTNADDPMGAIFQQLETQLVGDDPVEILTKLANNFYHPDRNWFIAADLMFRGWELRVLFNDPTMYGLSLSAGWNPPTLFSGLFIEILYQKISPNLGVYFGALTLPYFMRRIVLEGVILILPGFSIWVYTNGDFRINVGWPLGDSSIGIQVGILQGIAGFYFAKLRSADNPGAQKGTQYDLILAFGIGLSVFVKESFNASIFSATLSVSVTATLQGLLAWQTGGVTSGPPDHYWFAGTAALAVLLEGTVNFAILKASVTVSLNANAGVAFETGYKTLISVSASVSVRVSVHVIFFTIHLSFSTMVSTSFTIGSGNGVASVNGPLDPGLVPFGPSPQTLALHAQALASFRSLIEKPEPGIESLPTAPRLAVSTIAAAPQLINLYFVLQPTATYENSSSAIDLIASLFIESPSPASSPNAPKTDFENLLVAIVMWLANNYSTPGEVWSVRFQQVANALGSGSEDPPGFGGLSGFTTKFKEFLQRDLVFLIHSVDSSNPPNFGAAAIFPAFEDLELIYTDANNQQQTLSFSSYNLTPTNYPDAVNAYFAELSSTFSAPASAEALEDSVGSTPTGPSMASYLFYDYFLMLARNAINTLITAAQAYEKPLEKSYLDQVEAAHEQLDRDYFGFVNIVSAYSSAITGDAELDYLFEHFDYISAAGLGSRYMLHGLQLPDPNQPLSVAALSMATPESKSQVKTGGLYALTGQQFSVQAGDAAGQAELTTNAPLNWLTFESGSPGSAVCTIALPTAVPPKPSPTWQITGSLLAGVANGVIQLSELPPLTAHPLYFALKSQIAWVAPDGQKTILPLPAPLQALAESQQGIRLEISTEPPPDTMGPQVKTSPDETLPTIPGLLIRLTLSRVPANAAGDVGPGGSPATGSPSAGGQSIQYLPNVYQLTGADEATRDLIYEALQRPDLLENASIHLLYTPVGASNLQSQKLSPSVLLAKTNLSTLNQAASVSSQFAEDMMALQAQAKREYTDFAPVADVKAFLRLIWEVSVVNAPGFFLFYLNSDWEDLPSSLFSDAGSSGGGQAAQFDILVQLAPQPEVQVQVVPWSNCVWFDGTAPLGSMYAAVLDNNGLPVPQYSPTYPAGYVGFEIDWNTAQQSPEPEIPVDTLYQMIQFSILQTTLYSSSVWSLPVGPTKNGALAQQGPDSSDDSNWHYQQTVPVYRFAGAQSPPQDTDRYCAIGKTVELGFRLIDIYGNPLPDVHQSNITPRYQDPLISIGQWPGTYVNYSFQSSLKSGEASLVFRINFEPESIVPSGAYGSPASPPEASGFNPQQLWQAALSRYELILDQLEDPHVKIAVTTSLASGPLGNVQEICGRLQQYVMQVIAQIQNALNSGSAPAGWSTSTTGAQPVDLSLVLSVPFSAIVALPVDITPVTVEIDFERDRSLVYPPALVESPTVWKISYAVPARIDEVDSPPSSPSRSGLTMFARSFESAFENFDGAKGMLKLAQRSGVQTADDTSAMAALWAIRWSEKAGISVEFEDAPVYFALKPLSTKLLSYDVDGMTFANVDLDVWARDFLAAVDSFLLPANAVAVALLDESDGTTYYDDLMKAKQSLADSVPQGLTWILEQQMDTGDITAAREQLKQALLTALSSAFTISTVAQFRAEVKVVGRAEDKPSPNPMPPSLFGSVGPPTTGSSASDSSSPNAPRQYSISNGELDLATGDQWMTVLVTVAQPKAQAELELNLVYEASYLQHDFNPGEEYQGYVPSSWLKFVLPDTPPLSMPITGDDAAHIPIPLLFYPDPPVLIDQSASAAALGSPALSSPNNIDNEIAEALEWIYQVQIGHNWAHQDELCFTATYNLPVTQMMAGVEEVDPLYDLFAALVRFRKSYADISPHFGQITKEAYPNTSGVVESPGRAQELIAAFTREVSNVAAAWAKLYQPIFEAESDGIGELTIIIDDYYMYLDNDGFVNLLARTQGGGNPKYWPKVILGGGISWQPDRNQATPVGSPGGWWQLRHNFGPAANLDQMTFEWGPLDVLERQTATLNAFIKRNANLLGDINITINPDFIYITPTVQFASPIIPLIQRAALPPLQPEKTLVKTLESILKPIVGVGRNLNPLLRLGAGYSYQLVPGPGGGPGLRASSPILLADNVSLGVAGSPMPQIAADIGREIGVWFEKINPSTSLAQLDLSLILFGTVAGQQYPLVQIEEIPIMVNNVPASWWTSTE